MKICTITCHDVYNYGASLQAYALQHFLESYSFKYEIIDYKPDYLSCKYQFTTLTKKNPYYFLYKTMGPIGIILPLYLQRGLLKFWRRKCAFDKFKMHFLHCSQETYHSCEELQKLPPEADIYITGSDQVWNTDMKNGRDDAFYLMFAPDHSKKIAYAASFGVSMIPENLKDFVKKRLQRLNWVSIREATGVRIAELLNINATQVLDPVFLLTKKEWESMCLKKYTDRYLLLYYLGERSCEFESTAKMIAKKRNLKIFSINDSRTVPFADKNINNAGPIEFIEYLSQAEYILGTSFHATAFALIFNKQFCVFPIKGQNNQSRMRDLLSIFKLEDHFLLSGNIPDDINYEQVNDMIERKRKESCTLLLDHIIRK